DLADTLGTDAEVGRHLAERLHRAAEAVSRADHGPLPLVQVGEETGNHFGELALFDAPIRVLGPDVGELLGEADAPAPLTAGWLVEPARAALGAEQALDLPAGQFDKRGQLRWAWLVAMHLLEVVLSVLEPCELTQRSVRQDHRARQFADDLLHRLTHPPHRVPPERDTPLRLVALQRAKETDDA